MNSILVIHPYKYDGIWVFGDARPGLVQELFVALAAEWRAATRFASY